MLLAARLIRPLAVSAAVAAVTLAQLDLPNKKVWDDAPLALYGAVLVLAVVAVDESVRATVGLVQLRKIRAYERDMRAVLSAALTILVKKFSPPWERVGVHAFQLRGVWRWRAHNHSTMRTGARYSRSRATPTDRCVTA